MAQTTVIPAPDPQSLLPPLLACLPTAFASSRAPPALLDLLSPILQQRLKMFTSEPSPGDSWIRLLCWDPSKAQDLRDTIENSNFEPHPASGELEVGDVERISYKRLDPETLNAQIPLNDWSLTAMYLWCTGGEQGDAWKLAELIPYDSDLSQDLAWSASPAAADNKAQAAHLSVHRAQSNGPRLASPGQDEDDDDYWAQYDNAPERTPGLATPARKASINPAAASNSDNDYYERYGEVQPAMDGYDPDEHHEEIGRSTLGANHAQPAPSGDRPVESLYPSSDLQTPEQEDAIQVSHPIPGSPSSRAGSDTVARLERTAEAFSASEIAIKQHISYSVKSMYRLAKGAGIPRPEFEDMVQRELETLSLLDRED